MMPALAKFLNASEPIADLVEGRIFALRAPQGAKRPYLILDRVGDEPEETIDGDANASRTTIQIDCYAEDEAEINGHFLSVKMGDAVRNRISGYRGLMDDTHVCHCKLVRNNTLVEELQEGSDYKLHRVSMDFDLVYRRCAPDFT